LSFPYSVFSNVENGFARLLGAPDTEESLPLFSLMNLVSGVKFEHNSKSIRKKQEMIVMSLVEN